MPLNHVERNPYKDYLIAYHKLKELVPWQLYTALIIGSFPIHELTETIFPASAVKQRFKEYIGLQFYYGSLTNKFWEYLVMTLAGKAEYVRISGLDYDQQKRALIKLLEDNNIILTDIIEQTNRFTIDEKGLPNDYSSNDSALMQQGYNLRGDVQSLFKFNTSIIDWLNKCPNIKHIYFTAQKAYNGKSPGGWFFEMLRTEGIQYNLLEKKANSIVIQVILKDGKSRKYTLFFLPTPSSYRSISLTEKRQHPMFVNYFKTIDPALYNLVKESKYKKTSTLKGMVSGIREQFVIQWWNEFLIRKNYKFDGSISH